MAPAVEQMVAHQDLGTGNMKGGVMLAVEGAPAKGGNFWGRDAIRALASDRVEVAEIDGLLCAIVQVEICGGVSYRRRPLVCPHASKNTPSFTVLFFRKAAWGKTGRNPALRLPIVWFVHPLRGMAGDAWLKLRVVSTRLPWDGNQP